MIQQSLGSQRVGHTSVTEPAHTSILLLGIYPYKTLIQKDTHPPMFIAALFTIAKTWKQPKCPSTDEWIKKTWYIHTVDLTAHP